MGAVIYIALAASVFLMFADVAGQTLYTNPHCDGKQVIVHLFMWKWQDIASECEEFLSKHRYCAVQISPPNEHAVIYRENDRPWWDVYQPVSYKLTSRMGTEEELRDMVQRCNKVGVRIYVDAVINHMAAVGVRGNGSAGTYFNGDTYEFPGVPYTRINFNSRSSCPSANGGMDDVMNVDNVRNCELLGLRDLDHHQGHVRDKIVHYFNSLIDIGVAGFRVDASKHIWPVDLKVIIGRLKDVRMGGRPFFYHEVTDFGNEAVSANEYKTIGYVTEFRYSEKLSEATTHDFKKFSQVTNPEEMLNSGNALVFVDNHDTQRNDDILTHKSGTEYKMAVTFMLAYNYGFSRVMSSYEFNQRDQGPPHYLNLTTKDVMTSQDGSCSDGWVCEHRWKAVVNMVAFRNVVAGTSVSNWVNTESYVAFSRGKKGFYAMSKMVKLSKWFDTGLPAGHYCDVISNCETVVHVDGNERARIQIDNIEQPMIAIYVGGPEPPKSKTLCVTQPDTSVLPGISNSYSRTVVLIKKQVAFGQELTLMGGIDHGRKSGCNNNVLTSACAVPIQHREVISGSGFERYKTLALGDNFLDWYGREEGQGSYEGEQTLGSPMVWTTNQQGRQGYYSLNRFGPDYWAFDIDMDCSQTLYGWFELKARIGNDWEGDIRSTECTGRGGGRLPFTSNNHIARCGYLNVFQWVEPNCQILQLP